jgi:hypothetical protein
MQESLHTTIADGFDAFSVNIQYLIITFNWHTNQLFQILTRNAGEYGMGRA